MEVGFSITARYGPFHQKIRWLCERLPGREYYTIHTSARLESSPQLCAEDLQEVHETSD